MLTCRIRRLIRASIDDPYTMDHFHEPKLNALVVRPLVDRIYDPKDSSTSKPSSRPYMHSRRG